MNKARPRKLWGEVEDDLEDVGGLEQGDVALFDPSGVD